MGHPAINFGVANYGVINIAGSQAMSRAEFGLKLLDWWQIYERDTLTIGPADKRWPMDCRLDLSLATNLLATPLFGVDDVLALLASPGKQP